MIPNTSVFDITKIAAAAHELNRIYCAAIGDHSQVHWEAAPDNIKQSAIDGVQAIIDGVVTKPGDSHVNWLKFKEADGWVYGEKKDPVAKTHPCMVPFEQLPKEQQLKDHIFFGLVRSLLEFNERVLEPPSENPPADEEGASEQCEKLAGFILQNYPDEITEGGAGDVAIKVITKLQQKLAQNTEQVAAAKAATEIPVPKTIEEATANFVKESAEAAEAYNQMKAVESQAPEVTGHDTIETPADVEHNGEPVNVEPNAEGVPVNVADGQ